MTNDWVEKEIDDVAEVIGGGTPSTKDESNFGGDIAWITPKDLSGYSSRYISRGERNITEKGLRNSSARLLPKGSVLLTTRAPVGYLAISANPVTTNQGFHSLVPKTGYDAEFIYYLLKANVEILKSHSTGTTFGELTGSVLRRLRFCFPAYKEQRAIAHILGTLDDKIELNRQMNATLEAIARALFKSWFVDFDPVRAKAEGRQPAGMDAETAALFPAAFVDSELGKIPKGWKRGALNKIADITMGQSPPGETYNESGDGVPFYQGVRDFGFRFPSRRVYCTAPTRYAEKGDALLSVRAPVGETNIAIERCSIGRGLAALREKSRPKGYLYYLLKDTKVQWETFEAAGTVFGSASKSDLENLEVLIPTPQVIQAFGQIVEPLDAKIEANERESQTLAALRDTLLPKLISGEIRIKDAVRLIPRI